MATLVASGWAARAHIPNQAVAKRFGSPKDARGPAGPGLARQNVRAQAAQVTGDGIHYRACRMSVRDDADQIGAAINGFPVDRTVARQKYSCRASPFYDSRLVLSQHPTSIGYRASISNHLNWMRSFHMNMYEYGQEKDQEVGPSNNNRAHKPMSRRGRLVHFLCNQRDQTEFYPHYRDCDHHLSQCES